MFFYECVEVVKGGNLIVMGLIELGGMVNYVIKLLCIMCFGEVYVMVGLFNYIEVGVDFGDNLMVDFMLFYCLIVWV